VPERRRVHLGYTRMRHQGARLYAPGAAADAAPAVCATTRRLPAQHGRCDMIVVGCGRTKATSACPAADLYTGGLFRASRQYAEAQVRPWAILSALHGLIWPLARIAPYDLSMHERLRQPPVELARYQADVRAQLGLAIALTGAIRIEVHAGLPYVDMLRALSPVPVESPLAGLTIGHRLRWYAQRRLMSNRPSALNNNINKRTSKWVHVAARCHPIDSPITGSPVVRPPLVTTAPFPSATTVIPAVPVSVSCAPAIRTVMRRKPLLQDLILDAMLADPAVLPQTLATQFGTTIKSVQTMAGMWRREKLLPPRRLMQDLVLDAMLADPAVLPQTLATQFGTTIKTITTTINMWRREKKLPPKTAPAVQVAIPDTRLDDALAAEEACGGFVCELADVLGLDDPQGVDMADVLAAVTVATASRAEAERSHAECERLTNELSKVDAALGPTRGPRSGRIVELRHEAAQNTQLRSELRDAHAELRQAAHLTESDLEARMELWQTAARKAVEADMLRDQQQGVMSCGVVLSVAEMRQLASLRDGEAKALRVRALRGET